jgi:hypothetical protein
MMQHVKLVEATKVIGEWREASTVEEDSPNNMNNTITSRNIFELVGNASGEQVLAMLKAKEDEWMASTSAIVAKQYEAKDKREKVITAFVTTGSEIPKRLEQLGPSELLRLNRD